MAKKAPKKAVKKAPKKAVKNVELNPDAINQDYEIKMLQESNKRFKELNDALISANEELVNRIKDLTGGNQPPDIGSTIISKLRDSNEVLKKIQYQFYKRSDRYIDPVIEANNKILMFI